MFLSLRNGIDNEMKKCWQNTVPVQDTILSIHYNCMKFSEDSFTSTFRLNNAVYLLKEMNYHNCALHRHQNNSDYALQLNKIKEEAVQINLWPASFCIYIRNVELS